MKLVKLLSIIFFSSFILIACSTNPLLDSKTQNTKTFTLKQEINIAPNSARAFFQAGQYTGSSNFNRYAQHCRLEIKTLKNISQVIKPDTFAVSSINIDEEMIAWQTQPTYLAMNDQQQLPQLKLALFGQGNPVETMDLIHFYLKSNKQPDVFRLTCAGALSDGNPNDAPESYRPNKKVINKILGYAGKLN